VGDLGSRSGPSLGRQWAGSGAGEEGIDVAFDWDLDAVDGCRCRAEATGDPRLCVGARVVM
jgi:hypothetical protein